MTTTATTTAEYIALLSADALQVDYGAELLDSSGYVIDDFSDDLESGEIERDCLADGAQGTIRLAVARELDWSVVRVRPYVTITSEDYTARWNLGVYRMTQPMDSSEDDPPVYQADGQDELDLLGRPVGDTYVVAASVAHTTAVETAITTDAGAIAPVSVLPSTKVLAADMVWVLDTSDHATWLSVSNDLLEAINYLRLWTDRDGTYTSEPYASPSTAPIVWTFDIGDTENVIVGESRRTEQDETDRTNWWRFIQADIAGLPVEGAGYYTVDNSASGTKYKDVQTLDVLNQTELEAAGDAIVEKATQRKKYLEFPVSPLPILWHLDVVKIINADDSVHIGQVVGWRAPIPDGDWTLIVDIVS